jgi:hypothetical protein
VVSFGELSFVRVCHSFYQTVKQDLLSDELCHVKFPIDPSISYLTQSMVLLRYARLKSSFELAQKATYPCLEGKFEFSQSQLFFISEY